MLISAFGACDIVTLADTGATTRLMTNNAAMTRRTMRMVGSSDANSHVRFQLRQIKASCPKGAQGVPTSIALGARGYQWWLRQRRDERSCVDARLTDWQGALRVYFAVTGFGNFAWEALHLTLYTIWNSGTSGERTFAVLHCTGGDILIGMASLVGALVLVGRGWPERGFGRVAVLTVALGVAYTAFSEWLNVSVRQSWAYSE
jgi:hypothetical protein